MPNPLLNGRAPLVEANLTVLYKYKPMKYLIPNLISKYSIHLEIQHFKKLISKGWIIVGLIGFFLICDLQTYADHSTDRNNVPKVESWISYMPVNFIENKGQIVNDQGNPVPDVLFKAEAKGIDIYITKS